MDQQVIKYHPYQRHLVPKSKEDEEKDEDVFKNCNKMISSFPRDKGWVDDIIYNYQGFWFSDFHICSILSAKDHFKAHSNDILLASNPKSGTTWLKALIFAIVNRNLYPITHQEHPLLTYNSHDLVLDLELHLYGNNRIRELDPNSLSPRLLATHIPFTLLPQSVKQSSCRIIYICRNPKDTFVSLWHYTKKLRNVKHHPTLEEAFEMYMNGRNPFGPYWDHVMGYWKESITSPERVLFLKYEQMHAQSFEEVVKLAEFIGFPFGEDEKKIGTVDGILNLCSFDSMTNLEVNKTGLTCYGPGFDTYFRKGKVGDSENYLTEDMITRMDEITKHRFQGSGLTF